MPDCVECGCSKFVANPFKKGKCATCFHVHEGEGAASAPAPAPAVVARGPPPLLSKSLGAPAPAPVPVVVPVRPPSVRPAPVPVTIPAVQAPVLPVRPVVAVRPPGSTAPAASTPPPVVAPIRPVGLAVPARPTPVVAPAPVPPPVIPPSNPFKPALRPAATPAPAVAPIAAVTPVRSPFAPVAPPQPLAPPVKAAAPVRPPPPKDVMFSTLDDILTHVADLKAKRLGALHSASAVMQRAIAWLLHTRRAKAGAQAAIILKLIAAIERDNHADSIGERVGEAGRTIAKVNPRPTVRPYFLRPVNLVLRPAGVDATGDPLPAAPKGKLEGPAPFTDPAEVEAHVGSVRDARLQELDVAQRRVKGAFWAYAAKMVLRGVALAQGTHALFVAGIANAKSLPELEGQMARLHSLSTVLPKTLLTVRPFLQTLSQLLPPSGDDSAAVAAGVYVAPPPLPDLPAVFAYGASVHAARLAHLHACQRVVHRAYTRYMRSLCTRAEGLATLCATRITATTIAASDIELARLLASVRGGVAIVPLSWRPNALFSSAAHAALAPPLLAGTPAFPAPASVADFAQVCVDKRLAVLHACSTAISHAYRGYRYKMHAVGAALGRNVCAVLTGFNTARSDIGLDRLLTRLAGTLKKVPAIPDVVTSHLKVVNTDYVVVQPVAVSDKVPSVYPPPFDALEAITSHAQVLYDARFLVLTAAQTKIKRAYKGYTCRVEFAAVAMAEFVMSTIRSFERAVDHELDLLSDRVSKALGRVRGHPDAERIFLKALNEHMKAAGGAKA